MLFAHGMALIVVCAVSGTMWVTAGMMTLVLISGLYTGWCIVHPAVVMLSLHGKDGLKVQHRDGTLLSASVSGKSVVTSWLSVIVITLDGRRFDTTLLLLPDMLDADQYRSLRVWLKWATVER